MAATKAELEAQLQALGIEYDEKATKADLEALLADVQPAEDETPAEDAPEGEPAAEDEPEAAEAPTEDTPKIKVRVLQKYRDKYTRRIHLIGEEIEETEERVEELNSYGDPWVERIG